MRKNERELDEFWKKQCSGWLSHDLHWKNKTYTLKTSITVVYEITKHEYCFSVNGEDKSPNLTDTRIIFLPQAMTSQ